MFRTLSPGDSISIALRKLLQGSRTWCQAIFKFATKGSRLTGTGFLNFAVWFPLLFLFKKMSPILFRAEHFAKYAIWILILEHFLDLKACYPDWHKCKFFLSRVLVMIYLRSCFFVVFFFTKDKIEEQSIMGTKHTIPDNKVHWLELSWRIFEILHKRFWFINISEK